MWKTKVAHLIPCSRKWSKVVEATGLETEVGKEENNVEKGLHTTIIIEK